MENRFVVLGQTQEGDNSENFDLLYTHDGVYKFMNRSSYTWGTILFGMLSLWLLGSFASVSADPGSFNFIMHGDWGWPGVNQSLVADQMGIYAETLDARFVIALGL